MSENFKNNKRLLLSYNSLINQSEIYGILSNDYLVQNAPVFINPFFKLIQTSEDLTKILKMDYKNVIEYIYLNSKEIHHILYDNDIFIKIEGFMLNEFSDYLYLNYLIMNDKDVINYKYDFKIIKDAFHFMINSKFYIKKIILSIIIKNLISNYEEPTDIEDKEIEVQRKKIKKINEICDKIIKKYKTVLYKYKIDLNLDNIGDEYFKIEEIYLNIIKYLIKNNKLNESEETINLLKEIEIKNIRLTQSILYLLSGLLNKSNKYVILNYDDLFKEDIITFYSILFEYILKSPDYVFHVPFLLKIRKNIIEIIKEHLGEFVSDLKKDANFNKIIKLKKVLRYFIEFDYYYQKGINKCTKRDDQNQKNVINNNNIIINNNDNNKQKEKDDHNNIFYNSDDNDSIADDYETHYPDYSYLYNTPHNKINLNKEKVFRILSDSVFILVVEYNEKTDETIITYKKIIFKNLINKDEEISIKEVFNLTSKDFELNNIYMALIEYLKAVENETKRCKIKKQVEIELKFKMKKIYNSYQIVCDLLVNDDQMIEKNFRDYILPHESTFNGLFSMVDELSYIY